MKGMRLALIVSTLLSLNGPVIAEDARERVDQSCRAGMTRLKRFGLTKTADAYCGCVVEAVQADRIKPDDIPYVEYTLRHPMSDFTDFKQRVAIAREGLSEDRMNMVSLVIEARALKCAQ